MECVEGWLEEPLLAQSEMKCEMANDDFVLAPRFKLWFSKYLDLGGISQVR